MYISRLTWKGSGYLLVSRPEGLLLGGRARGQGLTEGPWLVVAERVAWEESRAAPGSSGTNR